MFTRDNGEESKVALLHVRFYPMWYWDFRLRHKAEANSRLSDRTRSKVLNKTTSNPTQRVAADQRLLFEPNLQVISLGLAKNGETAPFRQPRDTLADSQLHLLEHLIDIGVVVDARRVVVHVNRFENLAGDFRR